MSIEPIGSPNLHVEGNVYFSLFPVFAYSSIGIMLALWIENHSLCFSDSDRNLIPDAESISENSSTFVSYANAVNASLILSRSAKMKALPFLSPSLGFTLLWFWPFC